MSIGSKIREIRKSKKLSQHELANKADIAVNSLRLYEADKRNPKLETIEKIADALEIPYWKLLGGESSGDGYIKFDLDDRKSALLTTKDTPSGEMVTLDIERGSPEETTMLQFILGLINEDDLTSELLYLFQKLNLFGRQKAIERLEELTEIPKYQFVNPLED